MMSSKLFALSVVLLVVIAGPVLAQEAAPREAFKAVHLVTLQSADDVASLQAALDEVNAAVAKAGYPAVRYRLYKVVGKQAGSYSHLWESSWPGGEVYDKVHQDPEWQAVVKKHPVMTALRKSEVYNRYVEVPPARP